MGRPLIEIPLGTRYGHLVVTKKVYPKWECKCDCGANALIWGNALRSGRVISCGCHSRTHIKEVNYKHGDSDKTRLYRIWSAMKRRHRGQSHKDRYYDRNITLCDEWFDYVVFRRWALSNGYNDDLSIDRIDNDKGYYAENCRWADKITQMNNTSRNIRVAYAGKNMTIAEWSRVFGIKYATLRKRIRRGMSLEEAANV
jgi:hypothetical protein